MARHTGRIPTGRPQAVLTRVRAVVAKLFTGKVSGGSPATLTRPTGSVSTGERLPLAQVHAIKQDIACSMHKRMNWRNKQAIRSAQVKVWRSRLITSIREYPDIVLKHPELLDVYPELWEHERIRQYGELATGAKSGKERRHWRTKLTPRRFTPTDKAFCLDYWQYRCCVCGATGSLHFDHWIPLSAYPDCPGTIPENMVVLCAPCNANKHAKLPQVWLVQRYGEADAARIMRDVARYFETVKSRQNP